MKKLNKMYLKKWHKGLGCSSLVECLSRMYKALGSLPILGKEEGRKGGREGGEEEREGEERH